jgi:hypothetical protein
MEQLVLIDIDFNNDGLNNQIINLYNIIFKFEMRFDPITY